MTFINLNLHSVPFEDVNEIVSQVGQFSQYSPRSARSLGISDLFSLSAPSHISMLSLSASLTSSFLCALSLYHALSQPNVTKAAAKRQRQIDALLHE